MTTETLPLPITDTLTPESEDQVAEFIQSAANEQCAVYPIGGGASLNLGLPAKQEGWALQLKNLDQVVDYPARDMTITVGAGITLEALRQTLSPEAQRLPIDVPNVGSATLGGLIATNHSGPLRLGHGTMRDHVIGIRAVDGRGASFAGGGRVVKNVAGYDFCKLLTGSLGTLGVITEVTLKLKPLPPAQALLSCRPRDWEHAEQLLEGLVHSTVTPVATELLSGPAWDHAPELEAAAAGAGWLVVGLEGTAAEVDWMAEQLRAEWRGAGVDGIQELRGEQRDAFYDRLVEFPADAEAPLVLKITGVPSWTTRMIRKLRELEPDISIQAHAGNGVVIAKFAEFPAEGLSRTLTGPIKTAAAAASGSATILSNPSGNEMTRHGVWGAADVPYELMKKIKHAFDPGNILNPGRFVY